MINICVPVLNRYDLLKGLVTSLNASDLKPDSLYVFDNGLNVNACSQAIAESQSDVFIYTPDTPKGLAETWNWFIRNVSDERFIVNDDIVFAPHSIRKMVESPADFVSCSYGFSCFLLRDACVAKVGLFDEEISPDYAYWEDRDYLKRMSLAEIKDAVILCDVQHLQSQTYAAFTPEQLDAHNKKFVVAQENYLKKWGELPPDRVRQYA